MAQKRTAEISAGLPGDRHDILAPMAKHARSSEVTEPPSDASLDSTLSSIHSQPTMNNDSIRATAPHRPPTIGFVQQFSQQLGRARPFHDPVFIIIDTAKYNACFDAMYGAYRSLLFPEDSGYYQGLTLDQHRLACRYFLKMRIDTVYSAASGRRLNAGRIPISRSFYLPKALADFINSFGVCMIHNNSLRVIPEPEPHPSDPSQALCNQVTYDVLRLYGRFVSQLEHHQINVVSVVSGVTEGTTFWLLAVRDLHQFTNEATVLSHSVKVWSQFSEFTPSDAVLAAIWPPTNTANPLNSGDMFFTSDALNDAPLVREQYFRYA